MLNDDISRMFLQEDYGTQGYVSGDDIIDLVNNSDDLNDMTDSQLGMFIEFVLKYAVHSAPKIILKENMRAILEEAEKSERGLRHKCHIEVLTTSDVAYAVWQYWNSWEDWKAKIEDPSRRYECMTKYTATKGSGDGKAKEEGEKAYKSIFVWCRAIKEMFRSKDGEDIDRVNEVRELCNTRAGELGMLKIDKTSKGREVEAWERAEIEEAAEYDIMDVDGNDFEV